MKTVLVWDWPVRLMHWLLVAMFVGLIYTGKTGVNYELHANFGYGLSAVLVARILYGLLGSHHVRFTRFFEAISNIKVYLKTKKTTSLGHNPLGWLMVVALMVFLLLQVVSGLFTTDDIFFYGPLYELANDDWIERFAMLHELGSHVLIICVALHLVAVLVHEFGFKERLVLAMIHGKKSTTLPAGVIPEIKTPRIGLVVSLLLSLVWLGWLLSLSA